MKAVRSVEKLRLEAVDLPEPLPADDEAVVDVKQVGVCGTDIQIYHGLHRYMTFPVIQGHEGIGIVRAVGTNVKSLQEGDHVVLFPQIVCGECYACRHGRSNVCESLKIIGVHADGMFCERYAAKEKNLLKVPATLDFDKAALVEPFAVGVSAARRAGAKAGARVVILGAGTIGNFVAQACQAAGADVLMADVNDKKLAMGKAMGIRRVGNNGAAPLGELIAESFDGQKADAIVDCAGVSATLEQAITSAANASRIVIVGNFKKPFELEIPRLQRREVDLLSILMYERGDFEQAAEWMAQGKVNIDGIITQRFALDNVAGAFRYIEGNAQIVMKIMIEMTS